MTLRASRATLLSDAAVIIHAFLESPLKKFTRYLCIGLAALALVVAAASVWFYFYSKKPHARFVLNMAGVREPVDFQERELRLDVKGASVPVMEFVKPGATVGRYMVLLHGFSPLAHRDPRMKKMAASICDATGITVFIPRVASLFHDKLSMNEAAAEIADTYTSLSRAHPGRYYAFGVCMGASLLVMGLQKVPADIYPTKLLLVGPITDGKSLMKLHGEKNIPNQDIIFKLIVTANMEVFNDNEKALIRKAMLNAGSGRTDESRIRRILGERLFNDISIVSLKNRDMESVTPDSILGSGVPNAKFYILHSRNDTIVPSVQGKSIAQIIRGRGGKAPYLETGLLDHADSHITARGFISEARHMMSFWADFFAEER